MCVMKLLSEGLARYGARSHYKLAFKCLDNDLGKMDTVCQITSEIVIYEVFVHFAFQLELHIK